MTEIQKAVQRLVAEDTPSEPSPMVDLAMCVLAVVQFILGHVLLFRLLNKIGVKVESAGGRKADVVIRNTGSMVIFAVLYIAMMAYLTVFLIRIWR